MPCDWRVCFHEMRNPSCAQ